MTIYLPCCLFFGKTKTDFFMKKKNSILVILLIVMIGITGFFWQKKHSTNSVVSQSDAIAAVVSVTIDDGDHIATSSGVTANNPFDALVTVTKANDIPITTKQYDFGQFVQTVGNKTSSDTEAWIYFVNGTSGSTASDKYLLHTGDMVEWKFTTPQW
jgi:hypothetical protein